LQINGTYKSVFKGLEAGIMFGVMFLVYSVACKPPKASFTHPTEIVSTVWFGSQEVTKGLAVGSFFTCFWSKSFRDLALCTRLILRCQTSLMLCSQYLIFFLTFRQYAPFVFSVTASNILFIRSLNPSQHKPDYERRSIVSLPLMSETRVELN
jgi:hypothetical protein